MGDNPPPRWSISAVIPAYDRADLIVRAIDSALAQRRPPDEILVVDDGSTDETAAIVETYGGAVTLLRRPHRGVSAARNAGVLEARGEFVAFLDSDDYWDDGHLERVERALSATEGEADVYFTDIRLAPERGGSTLWQNCGFGFTGPHCLRANGTEWMLLPRHPLMVQSSVVRRDAYLAVGGCDESFPLREDTHLFFKLGLGRPVCAVAGVAGEVTADAESSLTRMCAPLHTAYLNCTTRLYADVLRRAPGLERHQRRVLVRRLARAHWDLARVWGARAPYTAASHLVRAVYRDPAIVAERFDNLVTRLAAP